MKKDVLLKGESVNPIILGVAVLIFGFISFIFGLELFSFRGQPIYFGIAKLLVSMSGLIYIISSILLFRLRTILIFGILSLIIFGLGLFSFSFHFVITNSLISISGFIYIISGIFLFRLRNWAKNLALNCSTILLFYFIPVSLFLITDRWGWGKLIAPLFLPYILFPLFFIIFLTRPRIKEQFKK